MQHKSRSQHTLNASSFIENHKSEPKSISTVRALCPPVPPPAPHLLQFCWCIVRRTRSFSMFKILRWSVQTIYLDLKYPKKCEPTKTIESSSISMPKIYICIHEAQRGWANINKCAMGTERGVHKVHVHVYGSKMMKDRNQQTLCRK